jgi:trans-AT polyketide synthase/acyltransferase/oxidoreductase domain-containing protein
MKSYVFPGQGSQTIGMGKELFVEYPEFVKKADDILGYSIEKICLEPNDKLGLTQYTQPALYTVNALSYYSMLKQGHRKPDYVAGHSLGEYNALLAAEVFDFETGLQLVKKRGELMSEATGGGMAAVIGLKEEEVRNVLVENQLDTIDLANLNSPYQIVISGPAEDILRAKDIFCKNGSIMYSVLRVSGAFHSRYMKSAADEFKKFIDKFSFDVPKIQVISNYTARPYRPEEVKENLYQQIFNGVKWSESICYLMGKNVNHVIQVGPGNVVSNLVKKIQKEGEPLFIDDEEILDETINDVSNFGKSTKEEKTKVEDFLDNTLLTDDDVSVADENIAKADSVVINAELVDVDDKSEETLIKAQLLGKEELKSKYNLKYPYLVGGMHMGISSVDMVVKIAMFGGMCFYGTAGNDIDVVSRAIDEIKRKLGSRRNYGINITYNYTFPEREKYLLELAVEKDVPVIELSSYLSITEELIKYKADSLNTDRKIIAKVSRIDLAEAFMSPAPDNILSVLYEKGLITEEQKEKLCTLPIADDICIVGDCAGSTDCKSVLALYPAVKMKKDELRAKGILANDICIGVAGGIGSGAAAAAAFKMGADFILTGSINQCCVEADTSEAVKDILEKISIDDLNYVKDGNMLDVGGLVQVIKRGGFFYARANNLARLYMSYKSINDIPRSVIEKLEKDYFRKPIELVYREISEGVSYELVEKSEKNPKYKMGLVFNKYYEDALRYAKGGKVENRLDYQIYCGPALGTYNALVKNTDKEQWRNRHVDEMAIDILSKAVDILNV